MNLQPMVEFFRSGAWVTPLLFIAGGLLAGLITEKIVLAWLKAAAERSRSPLDDIILAALGYMPVWWLLLAGIHGAVASSEMPSHYEVLANKVLLVVFILTLTIVTARGAAAGVAYSAGASEGLVTSTTILRNVTSLVVFAIGFLIILQSLGISIGPILGALGVGGLAVALALQDTLANLFAGLHIIASRQVRVGDYIKLASGEEGYVTDIRWRNTTVRALPNNMHIIPNSKLASSILTNFYQPEKEMSVLVQVGVHYDSDLQAVERITLEVGKQVMQEVKGGVPTHEPFMRYHTFADSSINFSVILRGQEFTDQYLIKHEFIKRLQARYAQEGIEIPYPIRNLYMRNALPVEMGGEDAPARSAR